MKEQSVTRTGAEKQLEADPRPRVLVVDDDLAMRNANAKLLTDLGYCVDSAEDGAAAWEALQRNNYDLLITDNNMPKITGVELVEKVRAVRATLPVIMVTGAVPEQAFSASSQSRPCAIVLKPYSVAEFVETVKNALSGRLSIAIVMLLLGFTAVLNAQDAKPGAELPVQAVDAAQPAAVTISVEGTCEYSDDGATFSQLKVGQILQQGATLRTGDIGRADVFFRRTGTTVRLQSRTEIRIEKMAVSSKDGLPLVHTLLDLRAGRIFTVVRSAVVGSTLEIRNAAGRSMVEGSGIGRYIITADGTHVCAKGSVLPLKVVAENGITILSAGEQFSRKEGKMLAAAPSVWVTDLIQLDELQASMENVALDQSPSKP